MRFSTRYNFQRKHTRFDDVLLPPKHFCKQKLSHENCAMLRQNQLFTGQKSNIYFIINQQHSIFSPLTWGCDESSQIEL